jgi:hypothetical protein
MMMCLNPFVKKLVKVYLIIPNHPYLSTSSMNNDIFMNFGISLYQMEEL